MRGQSEKDVAKIVKLRTLHGLDYKTIGQRVGLSGKQVGKICRENGTEDKDADT